MDSTGLAPAFSLVKGEILLHKLQAQGPRKDAKTKEVLLQGLPLLTSEDPQFMRIPPFAPIIPSPQILSIAYPQSFK